MKQTRGTDNDGLEQREATFCREYVISGGNGAKAAQAAGYNGDFRKRASQLLDRPHIRRVIDRTFRAKLSKLDVNADRVLLELVRIAFLDPRRFYHANGTLIAIHDWPEDVAACVSAIEYKPDGTLSKVRFCSKNSAAELLGRHLRLWEGTGDEATRKDRLNELLEAMRKPVDDGQTPTPPPEPLVN